MNLKQQGLIKIYSDSVLNVMNTAKKQNNLTQYREFLDELKSSATQAKKNCKGLPPTVTSVYTKLLNYIKSIQHFDQSEGYIEADMISSIYSDMHGELLQAKSDILEFLNAEEKVKSTSKSLAPKFAEGEISNTLPSSSTKIKLLSFNILAPFCRFYSNEEVLKKLSIEYNYIGDNNQSDYVVLSSQLLLAIPIKLYRDGGDEYVENLVENTLSTKLKVQLNLVESRPARNKKCLTHVFFWLMEAPRLTAFRKKINNSDLEWGLML